MSGTPPAVLLHGQPGGPGDWKWVIDSLAGRIEAIALTRPGYDGSPPGGVRHSSEAALDALDSGGIDQAIIVGHSYGGAIAAWLAAFHPERVAGLVLVAAAANRASLVRADRVLAAPLIGWAASAGLLWGTGLMTQLPAMRARLAVATGLPGEFTAAEGRRSLRLSTLATFVVEQRMLLREMPRLDAALPQVRAPTVVLVGTQDTVVPPSAARAQARQIPGARLGEVPGGGHVLNVQHPEVVAEAILEVAGRSKAGRGLRG